MVTTLDFFKYHGLGNDFVLLDSPTTPAKAAFICDRRRGIGADGVLVIGPPQALNEVELSGTVEVWNSDGSPAEICGNGLRCVALHLYEKTSPSSTTLHLGTGAGIKRCTISEHSRSGLATVEVEMGCPSLNRDVVPFSPVKRSLETMVDEPLDVEGRLLHLTAVGMGNPHVVTFDDMTESDVLSLGPILETHALFPAGANAGFATIESESQIKLTVWERGAGLTDACGSGACAAAVAACVTSRSNYGQPITVNQPGGPLTITVTSLKGPVIMKGMAERAFSGSIELYERGT